MMNKYQLALFGNPVEHSLSPKIHAMFAQQFGLLVEYTKILVPEDGFISAVNGFQEQGGYGANVTVPFKEQAFDLIGELSERANKAKAVNTLITIGNKKWLGDNTDGFGLVNDILSQDINIRGTRVLIIGAGGASRGVIYPISEQNPKSITITNRTESKAKLLAEEFSIDYMPFQTVHHQSFDIIINATSSSLQRSNLNIHPEIFASCQFAYDMMYSKQKTPFLVWAQGHGVSQVSDGFGMLLQQAAESFFLWTKFRPDIKPVMEQFR